MKPTTICHHRSKWLDPEGHGCVPSWALSPKRSSTIRRVAELTFIQHPDVSLHPIFALARWVLACRATGGPSGTVIVALVLTMMLTRTGTAVQIQDLVRLKGAETNKIMGIGLVTGLTGTGDGGKFLPAMRPLAAVIQQLIDPNVVAGELSNAKNVALVALVATLPASGVREGDRVDVHVSAIGPAKSLRGGRLFMIPMTGPLPGSPIYAFAEGPVVTEDPDTPTVGVVRQGAQLTEDITATCLDQFGRMTLILNEANASWATANNLANLINGVMDPDGDGYATAINQKNIIIDVPPWDRSNPAAFISQILRSYVDPSQISTGARVVVNERTGTIVVTGDVQISPVIISHKGLTITTISPPLEPTVQNRQQDEVHFVPVDPDRRGGAKLVDLLSAFNQLKVEAADRIAIVKEIHRSGKLHAQLMTQ